jgi:sec-independent protein translocase protein TatA
MFGLGTPEILIIAVVLVLLFGAKKIPDLMKGLGSGVKEFKKAATIDEDGKEKEEASSKS